MSYEDKSFINNSASILHTWEKKIRTLKSWMNRYANHECPMVR